MSFLDFGIPEYLLYVIRIIATIGGAIVGWFVCDPLTRAAYRLAYRAAAPGGLLLVVKGMGATALALVMYFIPFGGGGSGLGWGPGAGGVPGKGPGQGGDTSVQTPKETRSSKDPLKVEKKSDTPTPIEIQIISGKRFEKDPTRLFIVDHKEPAMTPEELDAYLHKNHSSIEVTPVLTDESIGVGRENSPLSQLLALTKKHAVKTLTPKTP